MPPGKEGVKVPALTPPSEQAGGTPAVGLSGSAIASDKSHSASSPLQGSKPKISSQVPPPLPPKQSQLDATVPSFGTQQNKKDPGNRINDTKDYVPLADYKKLEKNFNHQKALTTQYKRDLEKTQNDLTAANLALKKSEADIDEGKAKIARLNESLKDERKLSNAGGTVMSIDKTGAMSVKQIAHPLQKIVDQCRNRILTLQPVQDEPDDAVSSLYESLCNGITDFVDMKFWNAKGVMSTVVSLAHSHKKSDLLFSSLPQDSVNIATEFSAADTIVLKGFLWNLVWQTVFERDGMLAATTPLAAHVILATADAMGKLIEPRGESYHDCRVND